MSAFFKNTIIDSMKQFALHKLNIFDISFLINFPTSVYTRPFIYLFFIYLFFRWKQSLNSEVAFKMFLQQDPEGQELLL